VSYVTDLVHYSLRDGKISYFEAVKIIRAHNHLQHQSREELKALLAQHGISAKDCGMETIDIKCDTVNGGVSIRSFSPNKYDIPKRPTPNVSLSSSKKKLYPRTKRNLIFIAITGTSVIISALGLLV